MNVRQADGRSWIEGVAGFDSGAYASSVHGAQARILQALGETLSYDDLVCYGGFAFRASVHKDFCPSAGHPCCGFMCIEGSNRALPWQTTFYDSFPWGKEKADRAAFEAEVRAAIKASIDRGVPVHYGSEEDGLIIGYGDEGKRWWCVHPYHQHGQETFWFDEAKGFAGGQWPWGIAVWTAPKPADQRVPKRELTLAALKQAVEMWQTEKRGDYFCGDAAYAHWLQWLRDVEAGKVAAPNQGRHGSGWCFDVLIQNRRIAGRWLNQTAVDFPGESGRQLGLAAEHYASIPEVCMAEINCAWDLSPAPEKWTSHLRQRMIERLAASREHDRAAIAALTQARAALHQPAT